MKKKSKITQPKPSEEEEAFEVLTDAVFKNAVVSRAQTADPFEVYTYGLQTKIYCDASELKFHCLRGYHTLIENIFKKK